MVVQQLDFRDNIRSQYKMLNKQALNIENRLNTDSYSSDSEELTERLEHLMIKIDFLEEKYAELLI